MRKLLILMSNDLSHDIISSSLHSGTSVLAVYKASDMLSEIEMKIEKLIFYFSDLHYILLT